MSSAVRRALGERRFLVSVWPWRCWAYQLSGALLGVVVFVLLFVYLALGIGLSVVGVGLVLLAVTPLGAIPVAALERRRLRLVEPVPVATPPRPATARARLRARATWREFGYAMLLGLVFPIGGLGLAALLLLSLAYAGAPLLVLAVGNDSLNLLPSHPIASPAAALPYVPFGLLALAGCAYLAGLLSAVQVATARFLLGPRDEDVQVLELSRSRARLADAFEAERRRIEQDLHDGAQQQLVALTMTLGLAALETPENELIGRAQDQAREALARLRDLVRGINPRVLTDHGLAAAVAEVAHRGPLPVDVDIELPHRLPGRVETVAYFTITEALTNAAKHSDAERVTVVGRLDGGALHLRVTDDGRGGADPERGGGLLGLADRLAILGGRITVSSPPGGPTQLRVEIPCSG